MSGPCNNVGGQVAGSTEVVVRSDIDVARARDRVLLTRARHVSEAAPNRLLLLGTLGLF